jgi:hypothetical protein
MRRLVWWLTQAENDPEWSFRSVGAGIARKISSLSTFHGSLSLERSRHEANGDGKKSGAQ